MNQSIYIISAIMRMIAPIFYETPFEEKLDKFITNKMRIIIRKGCWQTQILKGANYIEEKSPLFLSIYEKNSWLIVYRIKTGIATAVFKTHQSIKTQPKLHQFRPVLSVRCKILNQCRLVILNQCKILNQSKLVILDQALDQTDAAISVS